MPAKRDKPKQEPPKIETDPETWARFEAAVRKVAKAKPPMKKRPKTRKV